MTVVIVAGATAPAAESTETGAASGGGVRAREPGSGPSLSMALAEIQVFY